MMLSEAENEEVEKLLDERKKLENELVKIAEHAEALHHATQNKILLSTDEHAFLELRQHKVSFLFRILRLHSP
jgi:hypothetical protein